MAVSKLDDDIKWRPRNKWVCHNMVALHMRRFCCLAILILNFTHYNCGLLHTTRYTSHITTKRYTCSSSSGNSVALHLSWSEGQSLTGERTKLPSADRRLQKQKQTTRINNSSSWILLNVTENSNNPRLWINSSTPKRAQVSALTFALDSSAVAATVLSIFVVTGWLLFKIGTMTGRSDKLQQWGSNSDLEENFYIEMEHFHPFWIQAETKFHLFWILYQSYWWWSKLFLKCFFCRWPSIKARFKAL